MAGPLALSRVGGTQANGLRLAGARTHSPRASLSAWPLNIAWNEGKGEKVLLLCGDSLAPGPPTQPEGGGTDLAFRQARGQTEESPRDPGAGGCASLALPLPGPRTLAPSVSLALFIC